MRLFSFCLGRVARITYIFMGPKGYYIYFGEKYETENLFERE
jgi:hypothetical protein